MPINVKKMKALQEEYGAKKGKEIYYRMEQKEKKTKRTQKTRPTKRTKKK